MNVPRCNHCKAYLLNDEDKPLQQITMKNLLIYHPTKGAGALDEAHFCNTDHLKAWVDEQFDRPANPIVELKGKKNAPIVGLDGKPVSK
jgi:hypothetical protein